jgi:guanyl-specific ribonuclease Sa
MTPEQRAAHCRSIASRGGKTTVERHGREHMSRIGKLGFQAAMASVGGHVLAQHLGPSYEAKFGRPITRTLTRDEYREKQRIWREARKLFPDLECVECGAPHAQIHHRDGVLAGNDPANIEGRCPHHHRRWHREHYREKRREHYRGSRPQSRGPAGNA